MSRDIDLDASEFRYEFELDPGPADYGESEPEYEAPVQEEEDSETEYSSEDDREYESPDTDVAEYAERFYELSQRQLESEMEAESALNEILTEMEQEYFFGSLKKAFNKAKRVVGRAAGSPIVGGLIKKSIAAAGDQFPAFQALKGLSALAGGDLRGLFTALAKSGLGAAFPGAGPFLPVAMKAMGFESELEPEESREAWNRFAEVAREAYDDLANNLNERADDPLEASRLANVAFKRALRNARTRGPGRPGAAARARSRAVYLRPGEEIVIRVRRD